MSVLRIGKHGVNPTIPVCFWCGEDKNEIALLGLNGGKEAKHRTVLDYTPCEKCQQDMAKGIAMLEMSRTPIQSDQPPVAPGAYPTGRWCVMKPEAVLRIFDPVAAQQLLNAGKGFMDRETADALGLFVVEPDAKVDKPA